MRIVLLPILNFQTTSVQKKKMKHLIEMGIPEEQKLLYEAIVNSERQLPLPQQVVFGQYLQIITYKMIVLTIKPTRHFPYCITT